MVAVTNEAKIVFTADSTAYNRAITDLKKKNDDLKKSAEQAFKRGAVLTAAAAAATFTLVNTYRKQEQAELQVAASLRALGVEQSISLEYMKAIASAYQEQTIFGDEASLMVLNMGLRVGKLNKEQLPRFLELAGDIATTTGRDMTRSARTLAASLADPERGLSTLRTAGVRFTESQVESIKVMQQAGDYTGAQTILLDALTKVYGGASKATADGTGKIIQMSNAFGDLQEDVGKLLIKAIYPLVSWMKEFIEDIRKNHEWVAKLISNIIILTGVLGTLLTAIGAVKLAMYAASVATGVLNAAVVALGVSSRVAFGVVGLAVGAVVAAITGLIAYWDDLKPLFRDLGEWASRAGDSITTTFNEVFSGLVIWLKKAELKMLQFANLNPFQDYSKEISNLTGEIKQMEAGLGRLIKNNKELIKTRQDARDKEARDGAGGLASAGRHSKPKIKGNIDIDFIEQEMSKPSGSAAPATTKASPHPSGAGVSEFDILQAERDAKEIERQTLKQQHEAELLRMHLQGIEEMKIEFYNREWEIEQEIKEARLIEDEELRIATLERLKLEHDALLKEKAGYYKKDADQEIKSEQFKGKKLLAVAKDFGGKSQSLQKAFAIADRLMTVKELLAQAPAKAAEAYNETSSKFPFPVGPALGALHAGLLIAQSTSAAGKARSAKMGGYIDGAPTPFDSQLILAQPGEHIVPLGKPWDEVKRGIVRESNHQRGDNPSNAEPQRVEVELMMDENAGEMFRAKITQEIDVNG